jgi:hypothetical protein
MTDKPFIGGLTEHPRRVQLSRLAGWRMPPNAISVARPGPWGNPFKIGELVASTPGFVTKVVRVTDAEVAVRLYREMLQMVMARDSATLTAKLSLLRGNNLGCWCPLDRCCHADVLLELANK